MDQEMIVVFFCLSIFAGILMALMKKSIMVGFSCFSMCLGLIVTAMIILITRNDGILVWFAGMLSTTLPFHLILKFKYPDAYVQLIKDWKKV